MNRFDNHDNYDDDQDYLVNSSRGGKQKWFKFSLLGNALLFISLLATIIAFTVSNGVEEAEAQNQVGGGTHNQVFGVDFKLNDLETKMYEPVCGKRCHCGMKCSLEMDLNPDLKFPCEKHNCKGYAVVLQKCHEKG